MAQDQGGSGGGGESTVVDNDINDRQYILDRFGTPPDVPNAPTQQQTTDEQQPYDVQSVQTTQAPTQQINFATPTEQMAAQGGGIPEDIYPYFANLGSGMQYLYSQWPYSVGGEGTPTELGAGGGYGVTSYQWSESPGSINELIHGRTPVGPALAAADSVANFFIEFGVRPEFITPFVAQSLGLSAVDMMSLGYVQDLYGRWIALDFGEQTLAGEVGTGGSAGSGGTWGWGSGGGYSSPSGFRSGYTSGLINWRIGI